MLFRNDFVCTPFSSISAFPLSESLFRSHSIWCTILSIRKTLMFRMYRSCDFFSLCEVSIHSLSPDVCFIDVSGNFAMQRRSKMQRKRILSSLCPVSPSFISYPRIFTQIENNDGI